MRSILLHIHEDDGMEARLQVALDLARQFDAHIACLQAPPAEFSVAGDFYGAMAAEMAMDYDKQAPLIQEKFESRIEADEVRWSWVRGKEPALTELPRQAPLHDLVILGGQDPRGESGKPSRVVTEMLFNVRAPILIVPAGCKSMPLDAPACVAWNGSAEAAHALRAAIPMLARASEVHVLTVKEEQAEESFDLPPTAAAHYLAHYDIEVEIVELPRAVGHSVAEPLLGAAIARKGGYLVMGAYGHSRFRELVFGGVTRDMLSNPKLPLLLSH